MSDVIENQRGELLISRSLLIDPNECGLSKNTVNNWPNRGIRFEYVGKTRFFLWDDIPMNTKMTLRKKGYTIDHFNDIRKANEHYKKDIQKITELSSLSQSILEKFDRSFTKYLQYYHDIYKKGHTNDRVIESAKKASLFKILSNLKKKGYKYMDLNEACKSLLDQNLIPSISLPPRYFNAHIKAVNKAKTESEFLSYFINKRVIISRLNAMVIGRPFDVEDENKFLPGTFINIKEFHARKLLYWYMLPGMHNKLDFEQIHLRYSLDCRKEGIEPKSIGAVKKFLNKEEIKLYADQERHGKKAADNYMSEIKGKKPNFSLSKGGYDGFQVDFYTKTNKGQIMLTVVAVFDYMSEAITGYDVNIKEDGLMVRNATRNHLNMFKNFYIEIESDRSSGNLAKDTQIMFSKLCKHITQPAPNDQYYPDAPNPKARYVERLIQEFNRLTQSFPGWKGTNFYTKDASRRPNEDRTKNTAIATIEEGIKQVIDLINIYNHNKLKKFNGKSRMEMFLENQNPDAIEIPSWSIAMILNQHTTTTVRKEVVEITVNRRTYEYYFKNAHEKVSMMLKGLKVKVYYDETNMDTVDIFGKDDIHLGTLSKLKRVNRAKAEQTEEDKIEFGRQVGHARKVKNEIDRKTLEMIAADLDLDLYGVDLKEARLMIKGALEQKEHPYLGREFYAEILESEEAKSSSNYYEDRLLRGLGMQVPDQQTLNQRKSTEEKKREYIKNKRKLSSSNLDFSKEERVTRRASAYKPKK